MPISCQTVLQALRGAMWGREQENSLLAPMETACSEAFLAGSSLVLACGPCCVDVLVIQNLGASLFQILRNTELQLIDLCAEASKRGVQNRSFRVEGDGPVFSRVLFARNHRSFLVLQSAHFCRSESQQNAIRTEYYWPAAPIRPNGWLRVRPACVLFRPRQAKLSRLQYCMSRRAGSKDAERTRTTEVTQTRS